MSVKYAGTIEKSAAAKRPVYIAVKRGFDILASLIASILLIPLYIIISLLIKAEDGGSIFYFHKRKGLEGRDIRVCKFRSMKPDADGLSETLTPDELEEFLKEYKLKNDPRVTKIGRLLRRTSLDEIPQIFYNILIKGDMSIVGPRPITDDETEIYGKDKEAFLSAKPGLTGYWAAYAGKDDGYAEGRRQKMELYYVENRGILLDLKIIFRTVRTVFERFLDK
ncbi:MAG: sugar transferase [Huintestinicola sp.]